MREAEVIARWLRHLGERLAIGGRVSRKKLRERRLSSSQEKKASAAHLIDHVVPHGPVTLDGAHDPSMNPNRFRPSPPLDDFEVGRLVFKIRTKIYRFLRCEGLHRDDDLFDLESLALEETLLAEGVWEMTITRLRVR